jgi:ABC-type amino acid transport substrate-binding protein
MGRRFSVMLVLLGFVCLPPGLGWAQTLDAIAAGKTIYIGYVPGQTPFAVENAGGTPTGYAIDLCSHVIDKIRDILPGATVSYVKTSLAEAFDAVASGRIDLLCSATTATLGRREKVDFSQPIFMTGMSALLRQDSPRDLRELFLGERTISPPRSLEMRPFASSRIGVREATITQAVLQRAVEEGAYAAAIVGFSSHEEGLAALERGDIDAYFGDRALLVGLLQQARHPSRLVLGTRLLTRDVYGIAMKRGDADLRLLVDRALSAFYATPDFRKLLETYFGDEAEALQAQIKAMAMPE